MPGRPVAVVAAWPPLGRRLVGDGDRGWVWGGDRNNPPANAVDQLQRPRSRHTAPKADDTTTTKYLCFSTHKHDR